MASIKQILNGNWICLSRCLICVQVGNISCDFSSKDLKDEMEILIGKKKKRHSIFIAEKLEDSMDFATELILAEVQTSLAIIPHNICVLLFLYRCLKIPY